MVSGLEPSRTASNGIYLKYGFTEHADDPHHLSISMKTIRKLGQV
jgi:hypothetical protein